MVLSQTEDIGKLDCRLKRSESSWRLAESNYFEISIYLRRISDLI